MSSHLPGPLRVEHVVGESLRVTNGASQVFDYRYHGRPKPFMHPVCMPPGCSGAGIPLTLFEPSDHLWHRGLWFTIKYVNGENFWEERDSEPFGRQELCAVPTVEHPAADRLIVRHASRWVRPGGDTALTEQRSVGYRPLVDAPTAAYALDWRIRLTAEADTVLDRTVFGSLGQWGGYGGLCFRASRNWVKTVLRFSDGQTSDRPLGIPARWAELSGPLDGGDRLHAGVAVLDHPTNPRHPTPWYGGTGIGHYVNPALLFHEPLSLGAGQTLALAYRVVVHDGAWEPAELERAWAAWSAQAGG